MNVLLISASPRKGKSRTFSRDIREKKQYPDQTEIIEKGVMHFKKIMQMRKEDWSGEYEYWRGKGWL